MRRFLLVSLLFVPAAFAAPQQVPPELAARQQRLESLAAADPKVAQCVKDARDRYHLDDEINWATHISANPLKFTCSAMGGASFQESPGSECCAAFERDRANNVSAAVYVMQECGWRRRIPEMWGYYLRSAEACAPARAAAPASTAPPAKSIAALAGMGAGTIRKISDSADQDYRRQLVFDDVVRNLKQKGGDFAVVSGGGGRLWLLTKDGIPKQMPASLAERIRSAPPFAIANGETVRDAIRSLESQLDPDAMEALVKSIEARSGDQANRQQFENSYFKPGQVDYFLPNTSISTSVGRTVASAEHSSIRGTINGGGDFIEPRYILQPAAYRAQTNEMNIRVPSGLLSSPDPSAHLVLDLAMNGLSTIGVRDGTVVARELVTGQQQRIRAGQYAIIVPGIGVTEPKALSKPLTPVIFRGSTVLAPGEEWRGRLLLEPSLVVETRLQAGTVSGGAEALEVTVAGRRLSAPQRAQHIVGEDGVADREVWDITPLVQPDMPAEIRFRNTLPPGGGALEVRLLAAAAAAAPSEQIREREPQTRAYVHSSGYQIAVPAGWTMAERVGNADVTLTRAEGDGLIEVSSGPVSIPLDPVSYAAGWESRAIGPSQLLKTKRGGAMLTIADRPAYAGTYENADVISKVVFLWTPGRFFTFAGTFARSSAVEGEALFDRLVQSFRPPERLQR